MSPDQQPPTRTQTPQPQAYDFIINPEKPPKKPLLVGANPLMVRVGLAAVGLLVLLVIFVIFKGLLSGAPKLGSLITVIQDQQELIHLTNNTGQQQNLSTANQNLSATTLLSLTSAQSQLITYMSTNHLKVKTKVLNQKVSSSLDKQLTNATTAGTYNQTFQDIMKAQLNTYINDLQQSYSQISGKKGRTLLSSDNNQAQLLLGQTNVPVDANTN